MFEFLRKEKYNEIDLMAEMKKKEVDYVIKVSEKYYSQIVEFLKDYDGISKEREVFIKTKKIISSIEDHCRPMGITIYHTDKNRIPGVRLGWLNPFSLTEEKDIPYTLYPSEKGFEIIDNLRKIRGQLPLRESVKKVRERLFSCARD